MLDLIFSHWNVRRFVQQDVCCLQYWIGEKPQAEVFVVDLGGLGDVLGSGEFGLPGGHALQLAKRGDAIEDPRELGMLRHLVLVENGASLRIETDGEERGHHLGAFSAKTRGLLRHGDGVVADNAEVELV